MTTLQMQSLLAVASLLLLGGCATCPINPPITQADPRTGYRFDTRQAEVKNKDNLVPMAAHTGGARALFSRCCFRNS